MKKISILIYLTLLICTCSIITNSKVVTASSEEDLIIGDDENYYKVTGYEIWANITVISTGKLIVPTGTILNASNIYLQGDSIIEINGGKINLMNSNYSKKIVFSGICSYFNMTNESIIFIQGSNGYANTSSPAPYTDYINVSMGGNAELNISVSRELRIEASLIHLTGGYGFNLPSGKTWTNGEPLKGFVAAGGNSTINLKTIDSGNIYIENSQLISNGGRGGKAANANGRNGGGYSKGGSVTDFVGKGGSSTIRITSENSFDLIDSNITSIGSNGGNGGNGADGTGQVFTWGGRGGGGGGYGGGDGGNQGDGNPGQNGASISGYVGSGGSSLMDFSARLMNIHNSSIFGIGGNGGDGGRGGNGGSKSGQKGGGGGGGGGYGGGGGGSATGAGGSTSVIGSIAVGGFSNITFSGNILHIINSNITSSGGRGGNGGSGGLGGPDYYTSYWYSGPGGGGGGGYGGAGGGGGGSNTVAAKSGGMCTIGGNVGDGGNASIMIFNNFVSISRDSQINTSAGSAGNGTNSSGANANGNNYDYVDGRGGEGEGRYTSNGITVKTIPMSIPLLKSPINNTINVDTPQIFKWLHLFDSTTNGPLQDYIIEMDDTPDFSSIEYSIITVYPNSTLLQPLSELSSYYWRVKARYSSPLNSNNGWSDTWTFETQGFPPNPSIVTPTDSEQITGLYNLTAMSDPDTESVDFYFFNDSWYFIGSSHYDSYNDKWFFNWDTTGLNLLNITISVNATDKVGLKGNNSIEGIEIYDLAPDPILKSPDNYEKINGLYNLTAVSDSDTESLDFYYYDGTWHLIGSCIYDSYNDKWYYNWDTSGLNLQNIKISVNATDKAGFIGTNFNEGIEIDNSAPDPILTSPENFEKIIGLYNLTAVSDIDTVSVEFLYFDGVFHSLGIGSFDNRNETWYFIWNTSSLNLKDIVIYINATDDMGLTGSNSSIGIEIDNRAQGDDTTDNRFLDDLWFILLLFIIITIIILLLIFSLIIHKKRQRVNISEEMENKTPKQETSPEPSSKRRLPPPPPPKKPKLPLPPPPIKNKI